MRTVNKTALFILVGMLFFLSSGCLHRLSYEKAHKLIEEKNYYDALFILIKLVKTKNDYKDSLSLLITTYEQEISIKESKIKTLKNSDDLLKWDTIISIYHSLNKLNTSIEELFPVLDVESLNIIKASFRDYRSNLDDARVNAARIHMEIGIKKKGDMKDKHAIKDAYYSFSHALNILIKADHKDADDLKTDIITLMDQCKIMGEFTLIYAIEDPHYAYYWFGKELHTALSDVVTSFSYENSINFLNVLTPDELFIMPSSNEKEKSITLSAESSLDYASQHDIDLILLLTVNNASYFDDAPRERRLTNYKTIEEPVFYDIEGEIIPELQTQTIEAEVTLYTIKHSMNVNLTMTLLQGSTGDVLKEDIYEYSYYYEYEWGAYTGDERALDFMERQLCNAPEGKAPDMSEMIKRTLAQQKSRMHTFLESYLK